MTDTEKRIAEIEAYARLGNNQDFLWLIAEVRRLKVFETSALDTINDLSFNADGSAFKSMLSNDAVRKERNQALAELRASQAEVAKLRDTFKEEHAELLVGSATLREERDAVRAQLAEAVAHIEWQQTLMKIEASLARTDDNTRLSEVLNAESTKLGAFLATVTK